MIENIYLCRHGYRADFDDPKDQYVRRAWGVTAERCGQGGANWQGESDWDVQ